MVLGPWSPFFSLGNWSSHYSEHLLETQRPWQGLPGTTSANYSECLLETQRPLTARAAWDHLCKLTQCPEHPPPGSPSRSLGNRRQTLSQDSGLCEQGISHHHNSPLFCHLLECNQIFRGQLWKGKDEKGEKAQVLKLQVPRLMWPDGYVRKICGSCLPWAGTRVSSPSMSLWGRDYCPPPSRH